MTIVGLFLPIERCYSSIEQGTRHGINQESSRSQNALRPTDGVNITHCCYGRNEPSAVEFTSLRKAGVALENIDPPSFKKEVDLILQIIMG